MSEDLRHLRFGNRAWTEEEKLTVRRMYEQGYRLTHIGDVIGRSKDAVSGFVDRARAAGNEWAKIRAPHTPPPAPIEPRRVDPGLRIVRQDHTNADLISNAELRRQHQEHLARRARMMRPSVIEEATAESNVVPIFGQSLVDWLPEANQTPVVVIRERVPTPAKSADEGLWRLYTSGLVEAPSLERIKAHVAFANDLDPRDFDSPSRRGHIVAPRQFAMALVKKITNRSLPHIGRHFGKDHTTVLHAVKKLAPRFERWVA